MLQAWRAGHDGQFVERERPHCAAPGDDERDLPHVASLDLLEQPVQSLLRGILAERDAVPPSWARSCADGEHEVVIAQLSPAGAPDAMSIGIDFGHAVLDGLVREIGELDVTQVPPRKHPGDRHGVGGERELGRDDRRLDSLAGEPAQGEQRLDRGDPAARDDHASGCRTRIGRDEGWVSGHVEQAPDSARRRP